MITWNQNYPDADSFIVYIKTEDIYKDIAKDVERRYDTSSYDLERSLSKGKNKKVLWSMKEELNGKIMMEIAALRQKTYNYLTDDNNENKKVKSTSKCTINRKLKFEDYKHYLEATQLENKTNQLEKKTWSGKS